VVFHLAIESDYSKLKNPSASVSLPKTSAYKTNVEGTFNLLHSALEKGTSLFIHSSSMSVYDYENPNYIPVNESHPTKPINFYGLTKLLSDQICQFYNENTDLKIVVLRYPGVYGPGKDRGIIAKLVQSSLSPKSEPIDVDENRTSDFVYVGDVVNANILVMEQTMNSSFDPKKDQNIFHIGSGVETSIKELAEMVISITKAKIKINPISSHHARRFYFDTSAAKKSLNYCPRDVYQGLVEYVEKERIEGGAFAG
jgi:UDP-glucose 4-epimerase